ncbi:MAG: rRNA adenine N-6-methyltransferase family protein [Planctomycetota bacterium]
MTFTVQFEMAERIASLPGKKDYGPLSVLVQTIGHVSWVRTLPPSVFWPRPQVQSAILRIDVDDAKRQNLVELREAHRFIRDLFVHRRKTLRAGVASIPGLKRLKGHLDTLFAELELPSDGRAEQLTPEELHRLFHGVKRLAETVPEST